MFLEERKGSELTELCPLSATLWIVAHQVPPPMGFSRQEYWSGFPTQGSNLGLPHCRQMLYHLSHQRSPSMTHSCLEADAGCRLTLQQELLVEQPTQGLFKCPGIPHTMVWFRECEYSGNEVEICWILWPSLGNHTSTTFHLFWWS